MALSPSFDVLVVDDNSPDGTASIVRSLQESYPEGRVNLTVRKDKSGLGTAYIHGFRWGLAHDYQYIFEMDADFSHNPKDLVRLYEACSTGGADLAVGSRYVRGGGVQNWPMDRKVLSYGASIYTRFITWMWVKDPTAGFICYNRKVLETINLNKIRFIGYAFQIEMKFAAWSLGFKIREVPIIFKDREMGESKINSSIIYEGVGGVLIMKLKSFFNSYKAKPEAKADSSISK